GSEREVMAVLDSRGLFPVRIAPAKSAGGGWRWSRRVGSRYMATFYSQLADLLRSGVPLLRSLDILARQSTQPAVAETLREVRAKVADGTSLADAMAQHPRAFTELAVSMVRAGQEGGFLEDVLKRIADFTEQQEDLKSKVIGALAYPLFLAVTGFVVLNVLVIFFVPQFQPLFEKLEEKGELRRRPSALRETSHFMQGIFLPPKGGVVMAAVVGVFTLYRRWKRSEAGRLVMDRLRLRLPQAGTIYLNLALSRFTRIL